MANPLEHEMQRKIILKLIHKPHASFNELWAKDGESNSFAYHLNKLEELNLVKKSDATYQLTDEGRKLSAFIEGDTGGKADFPTLTVLTLVRNGDKYLCQKRLKEPFYGYWGSVTGKINFGQNLFECATRDLLEETGLHATKWRLRALEQIKTYEGDKLLHHHYIFDVETSEFTGTLKEKTHKAEHAWMTLEEYRSQEGFPRDWFFTHIAEAERPLLIEAERFMKDGRFIGGKMISVREY